MDVIKIDNVYTIYRSIYSPLDTNMYILIDGKEAIVIDSNISLDVYQLLKTYDIKKVHLFLTHEHYDHSHGVLWFKEHFDTVLYTHENCKGMLSTKTNSTPRLVAFVLSAQDMIDGGSRYATFKNTKIDYTLNSDFYLKDGEVIKVVDHNIKIIHVPGHSPGSCLLVMDEKLIFTGDSLIKNNKIITCFKGGDKNDMINITLPKLKALSDDLMVMPGHGEPFKKIEFNFNIYNV